MTLNHFRYELFSNYSVLITVHHIQVSRAAVEGYTCEGEPPCIVMTFKTDDMSPPDLSLPIILAGVQEPTKTLLIKRPAEGNVVSINYLEG